MNAKLRCIYIINDDIDIVKAYLSKLQAVMLTTQIFLIRDTQKQTWAFYTTAIYFNTALLITQQLLLTII